MSPVGLLALSFYRLQRDCEVIIFDSLKKKKKSKLRTLFSLQIKKKNVPSVKATRLKVLNRKPPADSVPL